MSDALRPIPDEANEATSDLELLGSILAHVEAAIHLIDAVHMPKLHAALMTLRSRLGYEIEQAKQMQDG